MNPKIEADRSEFLGFSEVPTWQVAGCLRSSPGMMRNSGSHQTQAISTVRDENGQALAPTSIFEEERDSRAAAKLLTRDEARRHAGALRFP